MRTEANIVFTRPGGWYDLVVPDPALDVGDTSTTEVRPGSSSR